ncbi:MAG: purine-nucleoside phosphorylase [Ruminococcaceae bacterium]|nr:purine-nucleoside phosphorylase [Oscillospiraceae bacterium]
MSQNTPHINLLSDIGFGKTVLMPGDPKRAEVIAKTFLEDAVKVNDVRGVNGYTGYYKGEKVSVMASGMGMPSMAIYSYELYSFFGVESIIRVGSAGALSSAINVRDIIIGMGACTNSNYSKQYGLDGSFAPIADFALLESAVSNARSMNLNYHVGNILSSDIFYNDSDKANDGWIKMGVLAVEMEAAALYMNAARLGKRALAICTVSDNIITGESLPAMERQNSFKEMMALSLETAISYNK